MPFSLASHPARLRLVILAAVLAFAGLLIAASQADSAHASAARTTRASAPARAGGPKPTIVLEHGAWADASSWNGEIKRLHRHGLTVYAPPNPLRGLANDSATLADFLKTITGPVVLVGHSYGGMVITNAAADNPNVKALVYIDAFIPAQGETAFGLTAARPGSCVGSANAFTAVPYPGFAQCFANGLPASQAAVLAATQRPIAFSAGSAPSGVPAWLTIPSWSLIGTADHAIPPAELLFMSQRAHADITEVNAGHLSLISDPGAVTRVILDAARAVG